VKLGVPPQSEGGIGAPPDVDAISLEIGARAKRLRAIVIAAFVVVGIGVGAAAYAFLRSWFLHRSGMSSPIAVATLSLLPALAGSLFLARRAARWIVAVRKPMWIDDAVRTRGVDRAELEELTSLAGR
jgi:hypothetical protein